MCHGAPSNRLCASQILLLADVGLLVVAPDEPLWRRHLVDDRMSLGQGMDARVTALRFAATNMTACSEQPQIEAAAALLAAIGLGGRGRVRNVRACSGRAGEPAQNVHVPTTVGRPRSTACVLAHTGGAQR